MVGLGQRSKKKSFYVSVRNFSDRFAAGCGLALCFPLFLVVSLFIYATLGAPVVFRQGRAGLNGRSFCLYKFRTMSNACDSEGRLLPVDQRLNGVGRLLRRYSLDELPQLLNVLKGDMGFVGPRPLLIEYLDRYTERQRIRHEVVPGITGWAQVNGRNALSWEEKFELDVWYVEHQSFWLDVKILALTFWTVMRRDGISHAGHAAMPEFLGSSRRESNG